MEDNSRTSELYKQVREFANKLISEGGRYYQAYKDAGDEAQAVWEKAYSEVGKKVEEELARDLLNDDKLREALGETKFEDFKKFQESINQAKLHKKTRELATELISEGGKYFEEYSTLEDQLNSMMEKARSEARKQFGLPELTMKDSLPWLLLEPSKPIDLECTSEYAIPETAGVYILLSENTEYIYPKDISRIYYIGESDNRRRRLSEDRRKSFIKVRDNPKYDYYFKAELEYAAAHGCKVCWIECINKKDAENLEKELLEDFAAHYLAIPVANKQWPKKKKEQEAITQSQFCAYTKTHFG